MNLIIKVGCAMCLDTVSKSSLVVVLLWNKETRKTSSRLQSNIYGRRFFCTTEGPNRINQ